MQMLAVTTTSLSIHQNATWPYYSLPNYEQRTAEALELTESNVIIMSPIVNNLQNQLDEWDTYSQQNTKWILDGLQFQNETFVVDAGFRNNRTGAIMIPTLHTDNEKPFDSAVSSNTSMGGLYLPLWHISDCPTDLSIINYDLLQNDVIRGLVTVINTTRSFGVSKMMDRHTLYDDHDTDHDHDVYGDTPHSYLLQPIFDNFTNTSNIVGYYILLLRWQTYFENIIQEHHGIVCVVRNTCQQAYTYEINGPKGT